MVKRLSFFFTLLTLSAEAAELSYSVDSTRVYDLQEVSVSSIKQPATSNNTSPLQIMTDLDMKRQGASDLPQVLKQFNGVTVKDYGGVGGVKSVSVRSLTSQYTTVSYDGFSLNEVSTGAVDVGKYTLDNLSQITLSIGQNDNILLPATHFASAAVLNLVSQRPILHNPISAQFAMQIGSFDQYSPSLMLNGRINRKWITSLYGSYTTTQGNYPYYIENGNLPQQSIRQNSDVKNLRLDWSNYLDFGRAGYLRTKIYHYDSKRGLPGPVILYNTNNKERMNQSETFGQAHYENKWNRWAVQAKFKFTHLTQQYKNWGNSYPNGSIENNYIQRQYYVSATGLYQLNKQLSFSLAQDYTYALLENNFPNGQFPIRQTILTALSAKWKSSHITATATLLNIYAAEDVRQGERPKDKHRLTPNIGISYQPFESINWRLRTSYRQVYRLPNFDELYYERIGKRDLRPELSDQWNIGTTWQKQIGDLYLNLSADGYYNRVKDKIVVFLSTSFSTFINVGLVDTWGSDLSAKGQWSITPDIDLIGSISYNHQYAIDVTDPSKKTYKHQIPYIPRHSGSGTLTFDSRWIAVTYNLSFSGERYSASQNRPSARLTPYCEQNLWLNRTFDLKRAGKIKVGAELNNLFNVQYQIIHYYPMPGRNWKITLSYIY